SGTWPASCSPPPPRSSTSTTPASTCTTWPISPPGCWPATATSGWRPAWKNSTTATSRPSSPPGATWTSSAPSQPSATNNSATSSTTPTGWATSTSATWACSSDPELSKPGARRSSGSGSNCRACAGPSRGQSASPPCAARTPVTAGTKSGSGPTARPPALTTSDRQADLATYKIDAHPHRGRALPLLQHRQDVAGRVGEPGDIWPPTSADALLVLRGVRVAQQPHSPGGQLVHRLVDVIDREIQDRVGRGRVIGLGVDERVPAARQVQRHQPVLLRGPDAERVAVQLPRPLQVVHGEPAERVRVLEHGLRAPFTGWLQY